MHVISNLKGVSQLIGALMYGGVFRISEMLRLVLKILTLHATLFTKKLC
jgi:hypothetical protein